MKDSTDTTQKHPSIELLTSYVRVFVSILRPISSCMLGTRDWSLVALCEARSNEGFTDDALDKCQSYVRLFRNKSMLRVNNLLCKTCYESQQRRLQITQFIACRPIYIECGGSTQSDKNMK
eukprot:994753_1